MTSSSLTHLEGSLMYHPSVRFDKVLILTDPDLDPDFDLDLDLTMMPPPSSGCYEAVFSLSGFYLLMPLMSH